MWVPGEHMIHARGLTPKPIDKLSKMGGRSAVLSSRSE